MHVLRTNEQSIIFKEMLGDNMECYLDDLVFKSNQRADHMKHLEIIFGRLLQHQLKMNPLEYAFTATSIEFLEFITRHKGTKVEPAIRASFGLPPLKNIREIKGLQSLLAYIFISRICLDDANPSLGS